FHVLVFSRIIQLMNNDVPTPNPFLATQSDVPLPNESVSDVPVPSDSDVPLPPPEADPLVPKPYGFKDTHTETKVSPKSIRTYQSDMADAVRMNEGSVIKIAVAEQERKAREQQVEIKSERVSNVFAIGGVLLALVAIGVLGYSIIATREKEIVVTGTPLNQSLIRNDGTEALVISGKNKQEIAKEFYEIASVLKEKKNGVFNINPIEDDTTQKTRPTAKDFFTALQTSMPGPLYRSLSDEYMLGSISLEEKGSPFIILKPTSFDYAYSGMLQWEKKMVDDFFILYNINVAGENSYLLSKPFQDSVLKNQDARVLYDNQGQVVMLYLFVNNDDLIIIAKDESAVLEILNRLGTLK
ncbi:MAG: hypothetical protein KBC49_00950, partial [Candidatus Pacebacteria bacterium]|nr:hypothetical protein [Candidatus Paceibacterota bacterium]